MAGELHAPTGPVFRVERARGPVWYVKYRLTDGRQVEKKIGPAWTGPGRPAAGYVTKRLAEDWLRQLVEEAVRGTLPGLARTGATLADAAAEWLRNIEHDRLRAISGRDLSSLLRSSILPAFADRALEVITPAMIESWIACVDRTAATRVELL